MKPGNYLLPSEVAQPLALQHHASKSPCQLLQSQDLLISSISSRSQGHHEERKRLDDAQRALADSSASCGEMPVPIRAGNQHHDTTIQIQESCLSRHDPILRRAALRSISCLLYAMRWMSHAQSMQPQHTRTGSNAQQSRVAKQPWACLHCCQPQRLGPKSYFMWPLGA